MERTFDRIKVVDLRSLSYPVRSTFTVTERVPRSFTWRAPLVLDQGSEGACVGFGWAHELSARPSMVTGVTDDLGRSIYHKAQVVDPWPGEDYEGTSVQAGAAVLQRSGFFAEYRWCMNILDVVLTLGYKGPVVIGVDWYEGMWDTDADGFIRPTGMIMGGHCVMLNKVKVIKDAAGKLDHLRSYVQGVNSWGPTWGVNGAFRIALIDLAVLFSGGDFCVPITRRCLPVGALT